MKISQTYGHLSAICFHCFTRFVKQILADFLLLFCAAVKPYTKSAFFEQYAHIVSGFATISSCPVRDNAHHARVYYCARYGAPTRPGASAFALQKCVEPFSLQGSKSAIVHHILPKMTFPCRFRRHGVLSVRRFVGTEFCRYGVLSAPEDKTPFSRILSRDPDSDPCAPSQTAVFAAISGFAARIVSFPVCGRVSKNTRRFRALNAFEKSSVTSTHIRRLFLAALALLTPKL